MRVSEKKMCECEVERKKKVRECEVERKERRKRE